MLLVVFLCGFPYPVRSYVSLLFYLSNAQIICIIISFVKNYLQRRVSINLTPDQKKHILSRFFALLNSEGTEDTKVLSIQILVLPMLQGLLVPAGPSLCGKLIGQPALESSVEKMAASAAGEKTRSDTSAIDSQIDESVASRAPKHARDVIDDHVLRRFVKEALFEGGKTRRCGNRLIVELLKISSILLEFFWQEVSSSRKDVIKFAWNQLKNDDLMTKHWAYVNISRFISVFETPAKVIHQVYVALLRSYQHEARDLVRLALDLLVPALLRRLDVEDFRRAIKYTNKVMYEEGNSVPQIAHIWSIVVRHPATFFRHRHLFVPQMVNSLTRLGLPANSPFEYRELSLLLVQLLLAWEFEDKKDASSELLGQPFDKQAKLNDGNPLPSPKKSANEAPVDDMHFGMDQSMVDSVANFLLRMNLLAADSTDKRLMAQFGKRIIALFRQVVVTWPRTVVQATYFEKAAAICKEADEVKKRNDVPRPRANVSFDQGVDEEETNKVEVPEQIPEEVPEEVPVIPTPILVACVDVFTVMLPYSSDFFYRNSNVICTILGPCFLQSATTEDSSLMRSKLKIFVKTLFLCEGNFMAEGVLSSVRFLMDRVLTNVATRSSPVEGGNSGLQAESSSATPTSGASSVGAGGCPAYYILECLGEISMKKPAFIENFTGSIIRLATKLASDHSRDASLNFKHRGSVMHHGGASGYQNAFSTPVIDVFEEATAQSTATRLVRSNSDRYGGTTGEIWFQEPGTSLLSLMACIRLVSISSVPFAFNEARKAFFDLLGTILDTSDSIHLLLTITKIIGKWLLETNDLSGPLTMKEAKNLLSRLARLERRGLPEYVMQPVVDHVACIVLELHKWDLNGWQQIYCDRTGANSDHVDWCLPSLQELDEWSRNHYRENNDDLGAERLSLLSTIDPSSHLLIANPHLRSILMAVYGARMTNERKQHVDLTVPDKTFIDCAGSHNHRGLDALWQLLRSNFEDVGNSLWGVVFVDFLLACSCHEGTLNLARKDLTRKGSTFEVGKAPCAGVSDVGEASPLLISPSISVRPASSANSLGLTVAGKEYRPFLSVLTAEKATGGAAGRSQCISAVRLITHGDESVCHDLFEKLFSAAWAGMPNNRVRSVFVAAVETLLGQPYHAQFLKHSFGFTGASHSNFQGGSQHQRMNPIQCFLRTLSKLQPVPELSADLLMHLACEYNSWYEVLTLLECQYCISKNDGESLESAIREEELLSLINTCYLNLNQRDVCLAASFFVDSCIGAGTEHALSLDVYGMVEDALEAYSDLIEQVDTAESAFDFPSNGGVSFSESEGLLWEERWVELNREMGQWEVLSEYAESSGYVKLEMECAWKLRNWDKVRSLSLEPPVSAALEMGDSEAKMSEVFLAIVDGKVSEVENLHAQTAQLFLRNWLLLPSIGTGGSGHKELLESFHQLVELRESGQIMVETSRHSSNQTLPDLKNLLR